MSGPGLARAQDAILEGRELLDADRAAGMQAAGGDADFSTEAEFAAVGELGRGVVDGDGAVEALEEGWLRAEEAGRSDEGASLCRQLHRLAATAAMFGEAQLGDKAAALEGALAMDHAAAPKESLARELLAAADEGGASQERAAGSTGE